MLELILVALGTALATGLGAVPVFLLGERAAALRPALLGVAAGVMTVAAIAGLLAPALDEGGPGAVGVGLVAGVAFLLVARHALPPQRTAIGSARRSSLLVFIVLFVHSLPEGLALGTAWASTTEGLAAFIVIAIAVQNVPEGTSVAIPMEAAGYGPAQQFWAAVATSAAAAGRGADRLPAGRAGRVAAPALVRVRGRGDARPGRGRGVPGRPARRRWRRARRWGPRRRWHARAERRPRRLSGLRSHPVAELRGRHRRRRPRAHARFAVP